MSTVLREQNCPKTVPSANYKILAPKKMRIFWTTNYNKYIFSHLQIILRPNRQYNFREFSCSHKVDLHDFSKFRQLKIFFKFSKKFKA